MASSRLPKNMVVIDDATRLDTVTPLDASKGLSLPRGRGRGYAYGGVAEPFPANLIIPRSEWQARIQEKEQAKTRHRDIAALAGLPHKDQANTNYCWINAPVYALEYTRVRQNEPLVILSPASAGARIKNFRNVGGWGLEGLQFLTEQGCCPVSSWPANAISRAYDTAANRELAKRYRVSEWWELRPRNHDELISAVLRGFAVAVGYNWWGHEVTAVDAVWLDGAAWPVIRNSWRGWGDDGYGVLQGNRAYADDAVTPRTAFAG
jgi:hypothetical protein